ncbi:MAG TPA: cation-transporting P-type ATPase [Candidatus Deferrimicrobiaceae bacterium]|nr:cation-transporting P-type ATPase [Candidatus Deferrimicrobiaceae bacterium]
MEKAASRPIEEVFTDLNTSQNGLSSEEALLRLRKYGYNRLSEKRQIPFIRKFFKHLRDLFGILLIVAAILSYLSGSPELGTIILAVVFVNILVSMFQESRAEKAMETLKSWMPEYAKVVRDGELEKISVREIVPGDIIFLEEGDRVPADARLIEVHDLWTNNVPLTGESEPQSRNAETTKTVEKAYLYSPNLVFMSTSVAKGQGRAVVYASGMGTQFGKIASLTQNIQEEDSPLQKEIALMAKYDFFIALTVGIVFFAASLTVLHVSLATSFLFMIGVMVCCVPEGLQVTVSSALAINVLKMAKQNVLVKRLSAVQTLGSVTVICTDKTGTITKGEMTVTKLWVKDRTIEISGLGYMPVGDFTINGIPLKEGETKSLDKLLEITALCNASKVDPPSDRNRNWSVIGDPTDGALLVAALKYGQNIEELYIEKPNVDVVPFNFERKRMSTIHESKDEMFIYTKGAPRNILDLCRRIYVEGKIEELTQENLEWIEAQVHDFANEGLRVIACAYKNVPKGQYKKENDPETDLIFVGLAAMRDPPREEVKEAVAKAQQAGIKTVIITGDYGPTAQVVAQEVGIVEKECCQVIRGVDLEDLSDQAIVDEVKKGNVIFARVSPEQKLRIVKVLKKSGAVVAVTGDGANDAPSLKEANIGVAMGASGTDVAREASDIVLLNDSFASIVQAVESGRAIYENIRKFIVYVFAHNVAELIPYVLFAVLSTSVWSIPLPLLVVQILAIDLAIDVIPSLALSREPPEAGIMKEPPRSIKERLFTGKVFARSVYIGTIIGVGALYGCLSTWMAGGWTFGTQLASNDPVYIKGITMTFAGIVVAQAGNVLACRTNKQSIFRASIAKNKWIVWGIIAQLTILAVLIYAPPLQSVFGTTSLGLMDWLYLLALSIAIILAEEARKLFVRRFFTKRTEDLTKHDHT